MEKREDGKNVGKKRGTREETGMACLGILRNFCEGF